MAPRLSPSSVVTAKTNQLVVVILVGFQAVGGAYWGENPLAGQRPREDVVFQILQPQKGMAVGQGLIRGNGPSRALPESMNRRG